MELTQQSLLEDMIIMSPKIDNTFPNETFFPNFINHPFEDLYLPTNPSLLDQLLMSNDTSGFLDALTLPELSSMYDMCALDNNADHQFGFVDINYNAIFDQEGISSLVADTLNTDDSTVNVGEKKVSTVKKGSGQPSKNLMAERRRRKRLNDRLSMLRSIVPKISKMDRTSILGDAIDYVRELLDKIQKLREDGGLLMDENINFLTPDYFREQKPNEMLVSNPPPPKFDVERRDEETTRVEVCCTAKPGLLISTLSTMDALGLDIHHCVISCFNDFSLKASCFQATANRSIVTTEDIKQALFKSAGYGGRCL